MSTAVFVYGTLLHGQSNHHWLGDAEFLGEDAIEGACLYDLGEYPMLRPGTDRVLGEVYQVSDEILAKLDELEEHPIVYQREIVTLVSESPAERLSPRQAWVYWGQAAYVRGYPVIASGNWRYYVGNLNN